jgi:hypothetical protein
MALAVAVASVAASVVVGGDGDLMGTLGDKMWPWHGFWHPWAWPGYRMPYGYPYRRYGYGYPWGTIPKEE